jgi:hypothetical protein
MERDQKPQNTLQEFVEKLRHLEEENRYLREASCTFGQLAERLNVALQQELVKARSNPRQRQRPTNDRRFSTLRLIRGMANDRNVSN